MLINIRRRKEKKTFNSHFQTFNCDNLFGNNEQAIKKKNEKNEEQKETRAEIEEE